MMAPQHLMGLMSSNPALAASSHPLFPPSAMLSNPGAFLALQPEAFVAVGAAFAQQQQQAAPSSATMYHNNTKTSATNSAKAPLQAAATGGGDHNNHSNAAAAFQQHPLDKEEFLTPAQRAKQNRDRNREHARSTRMRKKAYVQKLKDLVEGLHAERAEQVRARRVAVQHLAEQQQVRRSVVRRFLQYHCNFERAPRQWKTLLEDDFWLKQPVTPYRAFRRAEIEKVCVS